jgi:hypothetical protein
MESEIEILRKKDQEKELYSILDLDSSGPVTTQMKLWEGVKVKWTTHIRE